MVRAATDPDFMILCIKFLMDRLSVRAPILISTSIEFFDIIFEF